jgi:hypothetical protein
MPKPRRHHPERSYHGEDFGSDVVKFLNNFPGIRHRINLEPGQKRILFLLEMLRPIAFNKPLYSKGDARLVNLTRVNRRLSRYRTYSLAGPTEGSFLPGTSALLSEPFAVGFISVRVETNSAASYECGAACALMRLAELNLLNSLRICKRCALWFFARFAHQEFCRKECRIKHNSSSDKWKEYKRDKAREYYQLHKTGKVRER